MLKKNVLEEHDFKNVKQNNFFKGVGVILLNIIYSIHSTNLFVSMFFSTEKKHVCYVIIRLFF